MILYDLKGRQSLNAAKTYKINRRIEEYRKILLMSAGKKCSSCT